MARPRKSVELDDLDLGTIEATELDSVLQALPQEETKILLYRKNQQGRSAYIAEFLPSEFSLEAIKNTYGGGSYRFVAQAPGFKREGLIEIEGASIGSGRKRTIKKFIPGTGLVYITADEQDELFNKLDGNVSPFGSGHIPLSNQAENTGGLWQIITEQNRNIQTLQQQLNTLVNHPQEDGEEKFLKRMVLYKELFASPAPVNPLNETTKAVAEIFTKAAETVATAEGHGPSPALGLFERLMPLIDRVATALVTPGAPRGIVQPVPKIEVPPQPGAANAMPPASIFAEFVPLIKPYVGFCVLSAANDDEPLDLLNLFIPKIPDTMKPKIIEWLNMPTWFQDLMTLDPRIEGQAAWWKDFHDDFLAVLTGVTLPEDSEPETVN